MKRSLTVRMLDTYSEENIELASLCEELLKVVMDTEGNEDLIDRANAALNKRLGLPEDVTTDPAPIDLDELGREPTH